MKNTPVNYQITKQLIENCGLTDLVKQLFEKSLQYQTNWSRKLT